MKAYSNNILKRILAILLVISFILPSNLYILKAQEEINTQVITDNTDTVETKTYVPVDIEKFAEETLPVEETGTDLVTMDVVNPDGSITESGSGNLANNEGSYSWTATINAEGTSISWSFTVISNGSALVWEVMRPYFAIKLPEGHSFSQQLSGNGTPGTTNGFTYNYGSSSYRKVTYTTNFITAMPISPNIETFKFEALPFIRRTDSTNDAYGPYNSAQRLSVDNIIAQFQKLEINIPNPAYSPSTNFTLTKTDESGNPLQGAIFTLTNELDATSKFTFDMTNSSTMTINQIPFGSYILSETKVPDGYTKVADQTVLINSATKSLDITNSRNVGTITINKTGNGGAPLAGAGFKLTANGTEYTSTLSNQSGIATITNVPYGTYTLTETTIPNGYTKADDQTVIVDSANKTINVVNVLVQKGTLTINKVGVNGNPVAGAGFTLEGNGKTYTSSISDASGVITITGIDYGTYNLRESTIPNGYSQSADRQVTINSTTQTIEVINYATGVLTQSIIIINEDVDDTSIKLEGGVFEITGNGLTYTVTTDATGRAVLNNLPRGTYTVTQIKAADGYSVMPDNITFELAGVPAEVHAQNKKMPGEAGLPYIKIDVRHLNNGAVPNGSEPPIENVEIKLTGSDGSIRYGKTGPDGIVTFENLDYGISYVGSIVDAPYMYIWQENEPPTTPSLTLTTISPVAESTLFLSPVETDDLVIIAYEHGDRDIIIPGARFRITDPDGGTIEVTTGPDGMVRVPLPQAKLFSDLDKLEVGDKFYIHNIKEVLAYRVDQILVVEPSDFDPVLVVEGKDFATLLTCTPYMINSHRLLVRGERIDYVPAVQEFEIAINRQTKTYQVLFYVTLIMLIIVLLRLIFNRIKKNK